MSYVAVPPALAASSPAGSTTSQAPAPQAASLQAATEPMCPLAPIGQARCLGIRRTDIPRLSADQVTPATYLPGYGPADLRAAYNLPSTGGAGITIGVIDALGAPYAEADLAVYRSHFGLPACTTANGCFKKLDEHGGTHYPPLNTDWAGETNLDIQMVSAVCPQCKIVLVEANTQLVTDMGEGVDTAIAFGATIVSLSYANLEWSSEASVYDQYFNHPGVAILAGTGDWGTGAYKYPGHMTLYPASSPYVIAVGGTSLVQDSSPRGWSETVWNHPDGSGFYAPGGGCSAYEAKPSWQHDSGCTRRTVADIAAVADPYTGMVMYDHSGWEVAGGTSASTPIVAGIFALAGGPAPGSHPASYLYARPGDFYDVTSGDIGGENGACDGSYLCAAKPGYDGPTGLGTPNGLDAFVPPATGWHSGTYHPISPARVLDSRPTSGVVTNVGLAGKFKSGWVRTFHVANARYVGGGSAVAVPANATAVTGNLTIVNETASGTVALGPVATAKGQPDTIDFVKGDVRANNVTVGLAAGGLLQAVYRGAGGSTADVIFDVTGYFTHDSSGATYHALSPGRILDTRPTGGGGVVNIGLTGKFKSKVVRSFSVIGAPGLGWSSPQVPAGATAVTGNVTVTNATSNGYVSVGPTMVPVPSTSTVNVAANVNRANGVTVALHAGKLQAVWVGTTGSSADVIFDVTGYFTADQTGLVYTPVYPGRYLNSSTGVGLSGGFVSGTSRSLTVGGLGQVPGTAAGISGNLSLVKPPSAGWAQVAPAIATTPSTSAVNAVVGQTVANGFDVLLSGSHKVSLIWVGKAGSKANLSLDVTGYWKPMADQTITFVSAAPSGVVVGDKAYIPAATATSGLTVTFTIDAGAAGICSMSAGHVSFQAVGTCVIDAHQAGNSAWRAAPQVQQSFSVDKGDQTIDFTSLPPSGQKVGGHTYTPTATATSGLSVALTIDASATGICSISAGAVIFTSVGTCVIDANQSGNSNWNAAPQVQQSFGVVPGDQTITFTSTAPAGAHVGGPGYAPTATATSGLTVGFTIDPSASTVCKITGGVVSFIGSGTCQINADQGGGSDWHPAPTAHQSFAVND